MQERPPSSSGLRHHLRAPPSATGLTSTDRFAMEFPTGVLVNHGRGPGKVFAFGGHHRVPTDVEELREVPLVLYVSLCIEGYPSDERLWDDDGVWDKFWEHGEGLWIVRPPAAELKLMLEALSPGLEGSVMHRLRVLADELIACEDEEESILDVCQGMRDLLLLVKRAVHLVILSASSELAEAMFMSFTKMKVLWAFTWVETLLLQHAVLRDCSEEAYAPILWAPMCQVGHSSDSQAMRTISNRWETVHSLWPPFLKRTKHALDVLHRMSLLSCGRETEAVEDFEGPEYWKGFEACFLCVATCDIYSPRHCGGTGNLGYGIADMSQVGNRCLYWLQRAERAVPRDQEHWPLVRLKVLTVQAECLVWFGRADLSEQVFDKVLNEVQQIDLQLPFDFPVPLSDILYLKLEILEFLGRRRNTGWQLKELVPEIKPEVVVPQIGPEQAQYALACLLLRAEQLIAHSGVEEGLEAFAICLAVANRFGHDVVRQVERRISGSCVSIIGGDMADMVVDLDRADRLQACVVAHGGSLPPIFLANSFIRTVWAVCGFSGPATFIPSVVPALSPSKAVMEAFWESYKHSCASLSLLSHDNKVHCIRPWIPSFLLFTIHAVAATVLELLAANAEATGGAVARLALLSLESARNRKRKEIWPNIDWKWIERAHRACGPGAVFVQFAGGFQLLDSAKGLGMSDVCIVVQDEDCAASCHRLERIDRDNILQNVWEISDACLERKLESDCCRNALETLYDLLIRPLFRSFIRDRNWNPYRKLVISGVGCFQKVPFSILRNKDSGCYLFQEAKLAFTPSFLLLDVCQLRYESLQERTLLAGAGAAVALGDPQYLPYQGRPLPGSRREVDAICKLFDFCRSDHEIVKLLDDDATVGRLLEWVKKPSGVGSGTQCCQAFIHIAAHGSGGNESDHGTLRLASAATGSRRRRRAAQGKLKVMRDEEGPASSDEESHEPLFGHHMFQQEAESDSTAEGLDSFLRRLLRLGSSDVGSSLHCDDIMLSGSEWCASMVVLSACNTAVGVTPDFNELDVLSFSRAFMNAGVPCSVLSQWRVDDSAAAHLMVLFYEALTQGEDACSALQSAMIKMHQAGKYTLHQIAPFVVTGLPTVCLPPQMRRGPALELASSISKLQI